MRITAEMTVEEFEQFRAYQKDKKSLGRDLEKDYDNLRKTHENLCSAILTAFAETDPYETHSEIKIVDQTAAGEALNLATDWF